MLDMGQHSECSWNQEGKQFAPLKAPQSRQKSFVPSTTLFKPSMLPSMEQQQDLHFSASAPATSPHLYMLPNKALLDAMFIRLEWQVAFQVNRRFGNWLPRRRIKLIIFEADVSNLPLPIIAMGENTSTSTLSTIVLWLQLPLHGF